jgi:hypothetical protein
MDPIEGSATRSVRFGAPLALALALALAAGAPTFAGGAPSRYPATMAMRRGLAFSATGEALAWGTTLTAAQARWVTPRSPTAADEWGVWRAGGGPATFPVRSTDRGATWRAAGPQLASDWAGGSLYEVTTVLAEGPAAAVMVSHSVIDVTTDGGRQWYQYLHAPDDWTIARHAVRGGGVGLRISPASYSALAKSSYALYVLDVARHVWRRTFQSLG